MSSANLSRLTASLLPPASAPYRPAGRFAWHFARGKLARDPLFAHLLGAQLLPQEAAVLDLGCGQALLAAWLLAAEQLLAAGRWPQDAPPPPTLRLFHGIEYMPRDCQRAQTALAAEPRVHIECNDIRQADFNQHAINVITIFDVLHYFSQPEQNDVLYRAHNSLSAGGRLLLRVGDAAGGWRFRASQWVDQCVAFVRGHQMPPLHCRPLAQWQETLEAIGFGVHTQPMFAGTPFANFLLVCERRP